MWRRRQGIRSCSTWSEYSRTTRCGPDGLYADVKSDWIQFSNAMAAAMDMKALFEAPPSGFNAHGFAPRSGGRPEGGEQQSCNRCDARHYPHSDGRSQCDVGRAQQRLASSGT